MSTPTASSRMSRSPHTSVKVLPATPNASSRFPSNIRLVRNPPHAIRDVNDPNNHGIYSVFNEAVAGPSTAPPQSPGFIFARRKRTPFRGPMLHTNTLMFTNGPGTPNLSPPLQREAASSETVKPHTRKSQIIEEEDDDMEEDIEEVDTFSDPGVTDTSFAAERVIGPEEDGDETIVFAPVEETETPKDIPQEASLEPAIEPCSIPPRTSSLHDTELIQPQTDEVIVEQPVEAELEPETAPAAEIAEDVKTITPEETQSSPQPDKSEPTLAATHDTSEQKAS